MGMSQSEYRTFREVRRARILEYITSDQPLSLTEIIAKEGVSERPLRGIIKELEREHGLTYFGTPAACGRQVVGLGEVSLRLRSMLADRLCALVVQTGNRHEVAAMTGLNPREQIRAGERPYTHDWTLGQIERLLGTGAFELGVLSR